MDLQFGFGQYFFLPIGDASTRETLELAKIEKAIALIIATRGDEVSHKISHLARKMTPQIRVIARSFDELMAETLLQSGYADEVFSVKVENRAVVVSLLR